MTEIAIVVRDGNCIDDVTVRGLCLDTSYVSHVDGVFFDGDGNVLDRMQVSLK